MVAHAYLSRSVNVRLALAQPHHARHGESDEGRLDEHGVADQRQHIASEEHG